MQEGEGDSNENMKIRPEEKDNDNPIGDKTNDSDGRCTSCSCAGAKELNRSSYADSWYSDQKPMLEGCPFKGFHHAGLPSEFLNNPFCPATDKRSQNILSGMGDHSTGILMKMQFIVNNLKDCMGIWQQLFLQNLNSLIVHADNATVRTGLSNDGFGILKTLISYYVKETKCSMTFRYWCLFYNAFLRNLIPVMPHDLKDKLMAQLQKDFSTASQNLCRCKLNDECNSVCEPDEEHRIINSSMQIRVTSALLCHLLCKVGNHSDSTNDIYKGTPPSLNAERFIKGYLAHFYTKLYESSTKEQSALLKTDKLILMEILSHVLISFHGVSFGKKIFSSAIEVMLDMGCLSAAEKIKDMLLNLLQKEAEAFQRKGPSSGSKLIFIDPDIGTCFETLGLSGVMKSLSSLLNVEYQMLSRDEQTYLLNMMVSVQTHLGESIFWNGEYENIYLFCRHLQSTIEKKLGFQMTDITLDSETDVVTEAELNSTTNSGCFKIMESSSSGESDTSQTKLQPGSMNLVDKADDWAVYTESISKLRNIYANEQTMNNTATSGTRKRPISKWMSQAIDFITSFGKCCSARVTDSDD